MTLHPSKHCANEDVCNDVNRKFLISADLLSQLTNVDDYFRVESVGLSNLRGKKNILGLSGIKPVRHSLVGAVDSSNVKREKWLNKIQTLGMLAK